MAVATRTLGGNVSANRGGDGGSRGKLKKNNRSKITELVLLPRRRTHETGATIRLPRGVVFFRVPRTRPTAHRAENDGKTYGDTTRLYIVYYFFFCSGRDKWPLCFGRVWRALWTRWRRGHCRAAELRVFPLVHRRRRRSASRVPSAAARRPDAGARRDRTRHVTTRRRRESYARRTLATPPLPAPYRHPPVARGRTTFVFLSIPRVVPLSPAKWSPKRTGNQSTGRWPTARLVCFIFFLFHIHRKRTESFGSDSSQ